MKTRTTKKPSTKKRAAAPRKEPPKRSKSSKRVVPSVPEPCAWNLRLYVAWQTPRSTAALANLKRICEEHLRGQYKIEGIDLMKSPQLARDHQILAVPTLVRELPAPMKKIIGDLSNTERALVGLDLRKAG